MINNDLAEVYVRVSGKVIDTPVEINRFGSEVILRTTIESVRKSGKSDKIYVNYSSNLGVKLHKDDFVLLTGDIRTVNKPKSDFVINGYIFASSVEILDEEPEDYDNFISINNAKISNIIECRKSYSNDKVDIATYRISLQRKQSRFSDFSVTPWGTDAEAIRDNFSEGDKVCFWGRIQVYVSKATGKLYLCIVSSKVSK